ncbi:hypothetical protein [Bradyrhizobium forestalis]|uniref:hypothetical protein n=1 Tax=Bradyrhizobium forestalis TaxID=1419263 RepID=UPI001FE1025D|nr:hypothetical protein [Bradyrhizobium forestalis]
MPNATRVTSPPKSRKTPKYSEQRQLSLTFAKHSVCVGEARPICCGALLRRQRGFLAPDRAWLLSLAKFLLTGLILAAAFWLIARFSGSALASMHFHDELTLVLLAVGGAIVYALTILVLFGRKWLVSLVRG